MDCINYHKDLVKINGSFSKLFQDFIASTRLNHFKQLSAFVLIALVFTSNIKQGQAQTLGTYAFSGLSGCSANTVSSQPANATFSTYTSANTSCASLVSNRFDRYAWNTSSTINTSEYNTFTITPKAGYVLNLTNLTFTQYTSNNKSTTWALRSSLDNYTSNIAIGTATTTSQNPSVNFPAGFSNIGAITFRLYLMNAYSSSSHWSNDNVTLMGTATLACTVPAAPANPTSNSPQCASPGVIITQTGTPATGITWYWQGTNSAGTSTALNASSSYTATTSGTYYIRAKSNSGACWSATSGSIAVLVNQLPGITLGSDATICFGTTTAGVSYSSTTLSPDKYSIDYDGTAEAAGFIDVINATLPISPIPLIVSPGAVAGSYNYIISVKNTSTGCSSQSVSKKIIIKAPATVNAGGPNTALQSSSPVPIALSGASVGGSATTGAWSIISGGGSLSSTSQTISPQTVTYTPAANYTGTVILRLTSNSIICPATSQDRIINIDPLTQRTFNSSSTFTVPAGITSLTVECWGGGGGGGGNISLTDGGGGGGGGAYSKSVLSVVPGTVYSLTVGNGGSGGNAGSDGGIGADSWFINSTTILAKGGGKGLKKSGLIIGASSGNGGAGGSALLGIGAIKYSGGNGAKGYDGLFGSGGGGGSSAGTGANGGNAPLANGGTNTGGIAPTGGGNGGFGKYLYNGESGKIPGGGGGGSSILTAGSGGNGANGKIIISWTNGPTITLTSALGTDQQSVFKNSAITKITYSIGGGATGASISGLPGGVTGLFSAGVFTITGTPSITGTYNYTITTSGGSSVAKAFGSITVKSLLAINASATSICVGDSIILTASGEATFLWSTGATTNTIIVKPTANTTYTVTGTTAGISSSKTISIVVKTIPIVSVTTTLKPSTVLTFDGHGLISATGISTLFSYLWKGPNGYLSNNYSPLNLCAGTHSVTVTDSIGCKTVTTHSVAPCSPTYTVETTEPCFGESNGSINLKGFSWNNDTCKNCPGTVYTCNDGDPLINVGTNISVGPGQVKRLTGSFYGSINIDGGTLIICSSVWVKGIHLTNGATIIVIGSLHINDHFTIPPTCKIINNSGNIFFEKSLTVDGLFFNLSGSATIQSMLVNNASKVFNCSSLKVNGISFAINFDWLNPPAGCSSGGNNGNTESCKVTWIGTSQTGTYIKNLPAGTYIASFKCNNCEKFDTIVLGQPAAPISINLISITPSSSKCDGAINVSASGGTPPYIFRIDHEVKTPPFSNLCVGPHKVKVTDSNGCYIITTYTIDTAEKGCCPGLAKIKVTQPNCDKKYGKLELVIGKDTCNDFGSCSIGHILSKICDKDFHVPSVKCSDSTRELSILNCIVNIGEIVSVNKSFIGDIVMNGGTLVIGKNCVINNLDFKSGNICFNADVVVGNLICPELGNRKIEINADVKFMSGSYHGCIENFGFLTIQDNCVIPYGITSICKGDFNIFGNFENKGIFNKYAGFLTSGFHVFGNYHNIGVVNNFCKFIVDGLYCEKGIRNDHDSLFCSKWPPPLPKPVCSVVWKDIDGNVLGSKNAIDNLPAGQYISVVKCDNKCVKIDTITIGAPNGLSPVMVSLVSKTNSDATICNGSATVAVTGGNPPYTYEWVGIIQTNPTALGLCSGNYFVIVRDVNGCSDTLNVPIGIKKPCDFTVAGTVTKPTCALKADGAITLTVTPNTVNVTYDWSTGATTKDLANVSPDIYAVEITSAGGVCIQNISFNVLLQTNDCPDTVCNKDATIVLTEISEALCDGVCDGKIKAVVTGLTPDKYIWGGIVTNSNIFNAACAKKYTVIVKDTNDCFVEGEITVGEKNPTACVNCSLAENAVIGNIESTSSSAPNVCNGSATVSAIGDMGQYSYQWIGTNQTTATATGLCSGNYHVIIRDTTSGCADTLNIIITADPPPGINCGIEVSAEIIKPCSKNKANGSINLSVSASLQVTYIWNTGATTQDLNFVSPGIYSVKISNTCNSINRSYIVESDNSCEGCPKATLEFPQNIPTSCPDQCNGKITALVNGINPDIYIWGNTASTSNVITSVCAGTYLVLAIDTSTFCSVSNVITVRSGKPSCDSVCVVPLNTYVIVDGFNATPVVSGGVGNYTFLWSRVGGGAPSNPTSANQVGLAAGTYILRVTSGQVCTDTDTIQIPDCGLNATVLQTKAATCPAECDGEAQVIITPEEEDNGLEFTWDGNLNVTGRTLINACVGEHVVLIKKDNGCAIERTIVITPTSDSCPPPPCDLSLSIAQQQDKQCFDSDGFVDVLIEGGQAPFTYFWETPAEDYFSTSEDLNNPLPGAYTLTVKSAINLTCEESITFTVGGPSAQLTASITVTQPTCAGGTGSATILITGGVSPYSILWSDGSTSFNRTNLPGGYYLAIVTDANGCRTFESFYIIPPAFSGQIYASNDAICFDRNVILTARQADGYFYEWTLPSGEKINRKRTIESSQIGTYLLTYTSDTSGCDPVIEIVVITRRPASECTPDKPGICEPNEFEITVPPVEIPACLHQQIITAEAQALNRYAEYIAIQKRNFKQNYINEILGTAVETFTMDYSEKSYQSALYYYNQAGNLVRTVMPSGVKPLTPSQTAAAVAEMEANAPSNTFTDHTLATTYKYNSLDQLVAQNMPDHNLQDIWSVTPATIDLNGAVPTGVVFNETAETGILIANTDDHSAIFTTSDTGATWLSVTQLGVSTIRDIQKVSSTIAYAVGDSGTFIKSLDGGVNWIVKIPPIDENLFRVYFSSTSNGIILSENGGLFTTTNGGDSWSTEITSLKTIVNGTISDASLKATGFFVTTINGTRSHVYVSTNGGNTWNEEFFTGGVMNDIIPNGTTGYLAAGPSTALFEQDNTTKDFTVKRTNLNSNISKINIQNGFTAVTTGGVLYNGNGTGTVWTQIANAIPGVNKLINTTGLGTKKIASSTTQVSESPFTTFATPTQLGANTISSIRYLNDVVALVGTGNILITKPSGNNMGLATGWTTITATPPLAQTMKDVWHASGANVNNWVVLMTNGNLYSAVRSANSLITFTFIIGNISQLHSTSNTELFTISNTNLIRRSADGINWTNQPNLPLPVAQLNGVTLRTQTGSVIGAAVFNDGSIYERIGASWISRSNLQPANQYAVADNGISLTAGDNGEIYRRISNEWTYQPHTTQGLSFKELNISADNTVRVATQNNIYQYASGTLTEENTTAIIGAITRMDNEVNRIVAVTQSGNVSANAGGISWTFEFNAANALFAVDANDLVAGAGGRVYNKTSGSWAPSEPSQFLPLNALAIEGNNAVAVGDQGTVVTSDDSGQSWELENAVTTSDLISVALKGSTTVAGSSTGVVIRSTNSWATWQITTVSGSPVKAVAMRSSSVILAASGNQVFKSTNSGASFIAEPGVSGQFNSIALDEDGYGFIVGNAGVAYRITPLNGTSFSYTLVPTDADLTDDKGSGLPAVDLISVQFTDRSTGYITQANGIVLKTVDGGAHWEVQEDGSGSAAPIIALGTAANGTLINGSGVVQKLNDQSLLFSTRLWYDELGRIVLSQNAKQFEIENYLTETEVDAISGTGTVRAYGYTLYDQIGRVAEVGELLTREEVPTYKHETQVKYTSFVGNFVSNGTRREITNTFYDAPVLTNIYDGFIQENLRPRVGSIFYRDKATSTYERATHYSYDVHGNVKSLVQEINAAGESIKKKMDYEYDLISGKVNYSYYQKDSADQLIHKYEYDGDNRIVKVNTSRDGIIWDNDAKYDYYAHGPLTRTIIGDKLVEQRNHSNTIQGWEKAVNGNTFSYALGYFNNGTVQDYQSISGTTTLPTPISGAGARSLFDGSVATIASNTPQFALNGASPNLTQQFTYDQLYRLTSGSRAGGANADSYRTGYVYDDGGNITNLDRFDSSGIQYDDMLYQLQNTQNGYNNNTNKLRSIDDNVAFTPRSATDIDDQNPDNYQYDDIGNLIKDTQEEVANIEWTVYGKIRKISRTSTSNKPDMEFAYDAMGKRVSKTIIEKNSSGITKTSFYLLDAQGNVLSIYDKSDTTGLKLSEQYLIGAFRLGSVKPTVPIDSAVHVVGQKDLEITDHLANVRVTLSDRGQIRGATDYYPFGVPMPGRNVINSGGYRYGFNGMEKDDEFKGQGNSYTTEFRQYDPRISRWLSIDPKFTKYPEISPYVAFNNNPITYSDANGDDPEAQIRARFVERLEAAGIEYAEEVYFKVKVGEKWVEGRADLIYKNQNGGYTPVEFKGEKIEFTPAQKEYIPALERGAEWEITGRGSLKVSPGAKLAPEIGLRVGYKQTGGFGGVVATENIATALETVKPSPPAVVKVVGRTSTGARILGTVNRLAGVAGKVAGPLAVFDAYRLSVQIRFHMNPFDPSLPNKVTDILGRTWVKDKQGNWVREEIYQQYGEEWQKQNIQPNCDDIDMRLYQTGCTPGA